MKYMRRLIKRVNEFEKHHGHLPTKITVSREFFEDLVKDHLKSITYEPCQHPDKDNVWNERVQGVRVTINDFQQEDLHVW